VSGDPEPIGFQGVKKVNARGGSEDQLVGFWYTPKQDERGIIWTLAPHGALAEAELHPQGWQKRVALACGGGQQVGYGYQEFAKDPRRALPWSCPPKSMIVPTGPDPSRETIANVDGIQGGNVSLGGPSVHACLWRGGAETFEDPHPAGMLASEVLGVGGGQQVSSTCHDDFPTLAALEPEY
jgi:hypothetical protein